VIQKLKEQYYCKNTLKLQISSINNSQNSLNCLVI
jgi:membrane-bound inhibitor of C-type lysozyme